MFKKAIALLAIALLASGCATASKLSKVKLGMPQAEVKKILGAPLYTTAAKAPNGEAQELWEYSARAKNLGDAPWFLYHDDCLVAWGRSGDFKGFKPASVLSLRREITSEAGAAELAGGEVKAEKEKTVCNIPQA